MDRIDFLKEKIFPVLGVLAVASLVGCISDCFTPDSLADDSRDTTSNILHPSQKGGIQRLHPIDTKRIPWHLDRIDQPSPKLDGAFVPAGTGLGVTIYVLDTGIRYTHEDFGDRAAPFFGGHNGDFVGDEWGMDRGAWDCHGHGTHVAAIAVGKHFGVASGANVRGVRVGDCEGRGRSEDVVNAIEAVTRIAVKPSVVLMSLDYGDIPSVRNAVEKSIAKGIVVVAAVGGALRDACHTSPGGAHGVIAVAGTNAQDTPLSFSNYGPCVDLFAPGGGIRSADIRDDQATKIRQGSSMAAALTAGAAALILESLPEASPGDVEKILLSHTLKNTLTFPSFSFWKATPNRLLQVAPPDYSFH